MINVIILCVRLDPRSNNTLFFDEVAGHPVYIDNLPSLITNLNTFYSFSLINMYARSIAVHVSLMNTVLVFNNDTMYTNTQTIL